MFPRMQTPMRQALFSPLWKHLASAWLLIGSIADHLTTSPGDKIAARDWLSETLFEGSLPVQITEETAGDELHPRGLRARPFPRRMGVLYRQRTSLAS